MDLATLKSIIKANSSLYQDKTVRLRFNTYAQSHPSQTLNLIEVSKMFGSPIKTYNQHVQFANQYGVNSFRYQSIKTNKTKKYVRIGDSKNFKTE